MNPQAVEEEINRNINIQDIYEEKRIEQQQQQQQQRIVDDELDNAEPSSSITSHYSSIPCTPRLTSPDQLLLINQFLAK